MASTKYHRLPGGEGCEECGSRQWYAQDGLRYCRNGHQLEGFVEQEAGEDDFNSTGRVTRRQREQVRREAVKLEGRAGRELYLEVLQFILRRQIAWLQTQGAPADLERIVRGLWALRVRDLNLGGAEGSESTQENSQASFGTLGESGIDTDVEEEVVDAPTQEWGLHNDKRWKLPRLIDTLVLCYAGCLILRLPVSTADFHGWTQRGEIDFLTAVRTPAVRPTFALRVSRAQLTPTQINGVPRHVRDRMPAEYHRALQIRDHIKPGQLPASAQELIVAFNLQFEIVFPPLNCVPILARYIKELALPGMSFCWTACRHFAHTS
jgi:RNA polymerase I-specific transcription initiation factor RRN7